MLTVAKFWLQRWLAVRTISHKIWLAVGINEVESAYSSRGCFREWLAVGREKDRFSRLFLLFYGLIVGKYALICPWKFRKFRWSFFDCIAELNLSSNCWPQKRCLLIYQQTSANQNTVHLKIGFIWKFSREWLLWTVYASEGSLRKKPQSPTVSTFKKMKNMALLFREFL